MLLIFIQKNKRVIIIVGKVLIALALSLSIINIAQAPSITFEGFKNGKNSNNLINLNTQEEITTTEYLELENSSPKEITIIFAGDIMLSRTVNAKMEKYNDYSWPFLKIYRTLNEADLVVANLESPFLKNSSYQVLTGSFSFKANPTATLGLKLANLGLLSLANNHTLNQGKQGIIDTIEILEENEIKFVGAGLNEEEARKPAVINIKDYNFAFFGYAYPNDYSVATANKVGIANMDIEKMQNDINLLKNATNSPDFIIILMHAGNEYVVEPNWQQKEFARAAIDAGADLVVGHHPHWPQTFEFYKDKPIIYSLGNFVFDQMWSEETRQGLLLEAIWQNGIKSLKLIPTKIYNYGQVEILATSSEKTKILEKISANEDGIIIQERKIIKTKRNY